VGNRRHVTDQRDLMPGDLETHAAPTRDRRLGRSRRSPRAHAVLLGFAGGVFAATCAANGVLLREP